MGEVPAAATKIALGKDDWLYEDAYLKAMLREANFEDSDAERFAAELKIIQNFFQRHQAELVVVIAPSKVSIYPEFLPDYYQKQINLDVADSDYMKIMPALQRHGVNTMDGLAWFKARKTKADYFLFSRGGTHWSEMAAFEFMQATINYVNQSSHVSIQPLTAYRTNYVVSQNSDIDILQLLNLLYSDSGTDIMPYPAIVKHKLDQDEPKIIVVGDSFAWLLNRYLTESNITAKLDMYYYFTRLVEYRDSKQNNIEITQEIDLAAMAQPGSTIFLVCSEIGLDNRFWGFMDVALSQIGNDVRAEGAPREKATKAKTAP